MLSKKCLALFSQMFGAPAWLPGWSSPPLHLHPPEKSSITNVNDDEDDDDVGNDDDGGDEDEDDEDEAPLHLHPPGKSSITQNLSSPLFSDLFQVQHAASWYASMKRRDMAECSIHDYGSMQHPLECSIRNIILWQHKASVMMVWLTCWSGLRPAFIPRISSMIFSASTLTIGS